MTGWKPWAALFGAFAGGTAFGFGLCRVVIEEKVREEYRQATESMRRALEVARELEDKIDLGPDFDLDVWQAETKRIGNMFEDGITVKDNQGTAVIESPVDIQTPEENAYHTAITAVETPIKLFVDGGINDYGMSYIEEEEYLDEDGRVKEKIDIFMDEHNPIFVMNGEQITNWDHLVGDSILVDMYKLCPPGTEPILYVRNHRTDVDYEVVQVRHE